MLLHDDAAEGVVDRGSHLRDPAHIVAERLVKRSVGRREAGQTAGCWRFYRRGGGNGGFAESEQTRNESPKQRTTGKWTGNGCCSFNNCGRM